MDKISIIAQEQDEGTRVDKFLAENADNITRSAAQKMLSDGLVLVNEKPVSKNCRIKNGDVVSAQIPEPTELKAEPENIPVDIVYEDECLLVVNKPKGMVVHPAPGNYSGTLVNALLYHCSGRLSAINGVIRPGIVHRIDKNTSGLLIVAKTDSAHNGLAAQIKEHSFTREYEAIVEGHFKQMKGTVDAPVGRNKTDRKKMCVTDLNSKNAVTHYEVLEELPGYSYIRLKLETGRTHQIRVHMKYIGHPVLGDDVYSKPYKGIEGQCLHARKIGFIHPSTGEYMEFTSELPEYFENILAKLRKSKK